MRRHLAKMEAKGQSAVGPHTFSVQLTIKVENAMQTYADLLATHVIAKLGLATDLAAQLPCMEA